MADIPPFEAHPEVDAWLRRKHYLYLRVLGVVAAFSGYVIWTCSR
jgi:hypothetical protein